MQSCPGLWWPSVWLAFAGLHIGAASVAPGGPSPGGVVAAPVRCAAWLPGAASVPVSICRMHDIAMTASSALFMRARCTNDATTRTRQHLDLHRALRSARTASVAHCAHRVRRDAGRVSALAFAENENGPGLPDPPCRRRRAEARRRVRCLLLVFELGVDDVVVLGRFAAAAAVIAGRGFTAARLLVHRLGQLVRRRLELLERAAGGRGGGKE